MLNDILPPRPRVDRNDSEIAWLTNEIRACDGRAREAIESSLAEYRSMGRFIADAKLRLKGGQFGAWCTENLELSRSWIHVIENFHEMRNDEAPAREWYARNGKAEPHSLEKTVRMLQEYRRAENGQTPPPHSQARAKQTTTDKKVIAAAQIDLPSGLGEHQTSATGDESRSALVQDDVRSPPEVAAQNPGPERLSDPERRDLLIALATDLDLSAVENGSADLVVRISRIEREPEKSGRYRPAGSCLCTIEPTAEPISAHATPRSSPAKLLGEVPKPAIKVGPAKVLTLRRPEFHGGRKPSETGARRARPNFRSIKA